MAVPSTCTWSMEAMRFGLQKLTLLDFPGVVACTVFTCGCNFRCPFCHNAALVTGREADMAMSRDELMAFLRSRVGKLDGVCVTGGEPLLHVETVAFLREVRAFGYKIKLDTNGSFTEALKTVVREGLVDYVAMDIKNSEANYARTCGSATVLENVRASVAFLKTGVVPYEFRTTVVGGYHTEGDFEAIARWIEGAPRYFLQRYTDSGDVLEPDAEMASVTPEQMERFLAIVRRTVPQAEIRGQ